MAYRTAKELAEKFGVTTQGINKYLRASGLREQCKRNGNRFLIPETVEKLLETHFLGKETKSETNGNSETKSETKTETVSVPWEVYEDLRRQLDIKDAQIRDLSKALLSAQEQGQAAQLLHAVDLKDDLLLESQEQEVAHRTVWQRVRDALRN